MAVETILMAFFNCIDRYQPLANSDDGHGGVFASNKPANWTPTRPNRQRHYLASDYRILVVDY